ncbi:MAG TPA: HDOD domain-containing protein [Candidatus Hydrogenedentes bacterium]|nr:HDOD domain-containing protein [Candidatus Hydrogenedentota bacterium]
MSQRKEILEKVAAIPALPVAAAQVIHLIYTQEAGVAEIMKAIEYDAGLTTDVLRLANSAYFAGPRTISTLRDAGVILGAARILQMVMASAIFPLASKPIQGYGLPAGQLIDHLVAVGIGSEQLAKELHFNAPQYTFTAGLLHDIGKVVLGTFIEVDAEPILQQAYEEKLSFEMAERAVLGIDHAEVGAVLLESWHLPREIVTPVRWHHQPDDAGENFLVADLVHAADTLSLQCGLGVGIDGLNYHVSPSAVARLNLKTAVAERVTCVMLSEMQSIRQQRGA